MKGSTMTHPPTRVSVDLDHLTYADLAALDYREFRAVVDADLKRDTPGAQPVPAWISDALRGAFVDQWLTTLRQMLSSVQLQLDLKASDYDGLMTELQGSSDTARAQRATEDYRKDRAGRLRFRGAVEEAVIEAETLYAGEIRRLTTAIKIHQEATLEDDYIEPNASDKALWATIANSGKE
jgi:hypothetical protein